MSTTRRVYPVFWREIQACFLHTTSIQQRCILYHTLENAVNGGITRFQGCCKNEPEAVSVGAGVDVVWWMGRLRRPSPDFSVVGMWAAQAPHPRVRHNPRPYFPLMAGSCNSPAPGSSLRNSPSL